MGGNDDRRIYSSLLNQANAHAQKALTMGVTPVNDKHLMWYQDITQSTQATTNNIRNYDFKRLSTNLSLTTPNIILESRLKVKRGSLKPATTAQFDNRTQIMRIQNILKEDDLVFDNLCTSDFSDNVFMTSTQIIPSRYESRGSNFYEHNNEVISNRLAEIK